MELRAEGKGLWTLCDPCGSMTRHAKSTFRKGSFVVLLKYRVRTLVDGVQGFLL